MQSGGNKFRIEMLHCSRLFISSRYRAGRQGTKMSQQLTISSVFCVFALASLCIVASTTSFFGDAPVADFALVVAELAPGQSS